MATTATRKIFVGGKWTDAAEGATMEVLNPATGETIAEVAACTAADVDAAVDSAKQALPEWLDSTPAERAELLLKLADVVDENAEELAEIESRNVGKPLGYARDEMPVCSDNLRFFAGAARILEGRSAGEYMQGYTSMVRREPLGIVGGIAPWNYPLMMAVWKLAPALAAGNVQVLKPSEQTPLSLLRFVELAQDAIPAGVLNVVTGDGVPVGERIVTSRPGRRLPAPPRTPSSASTSSSAARRPSSSSTTPTRPRSPRGSRSPATGTRARTAPRPRG
jgi:betaine-aldehyde dehydrogenase/aminobutyraldehyde dehydrogenase